MPGLDQLEEPKEKESEIQREQDPANSLVQLKSSRLNRTSRREGFGCFSGERQRRYNANLRNRVCGRLRGPQCAQRRYQRNREREAESTDPDQVSVASEGLTQQPRAESGEACDQCNLPYGVQ